MDSQPTCEVGKQVPVQIHLHVARTAICHMAGLGYGRCVQVLQYANGGTADRGVKSNQRQIAPGMKRS